MKRLLLGFTVLLLASVASAAAIPNLECSAMYDFQTNNLVTGFTSRILSLGDFDIRVGYNASNQGVASVSYDISNLEKLGPKVHYLWGDSVKTSIGFWAGYNLKDSLWGYGIATVLIQVNFQ